MNESTLNQDVRHLGDLLGQTIKEFEGEETFNTIESIRRQAKLDDNQEGWERLLETMGQLSDKTMLAVARAFCHFLNYANIAEQHDNDRQYRLQQADATLQPHHLPKSLKHELAQLKNAGISKECIAETAATLKLELVLTAHPTEVTRRTLLKKYHDIQTILRQLDRSDLTQHEREGELKRLKRRIIAAWKTDEIRTTRPTPIDEAKWGFATIEHSLWHAVPEAIRELNLQLNELGAAPLPIHTTPIKICSWMGGDRDGNPNVTATVTEEVIRLGRWQAADLILKDLHQLRQDLSMQACNQAVRDRVGRSEKEPYRAVLREIRDRVANTRKWVEATINDQPFSGLIYHTRDEILEPLHLMYDSLVECQMHEIAEGSLWNLIQRIQCFGLTLMPLDIRQHAERHAETIDAICQSLQITNKAGHSYLAWEEPEKQAFLLQELSNARPLIPRHFSSTPEIEEVLSTFRLLSQQPDEYLGAYIISMARNPSDVLAVQLLQKECAFAPYPYANAHPSTSNTDSDSLSTTHSNTLHKSAQRIVPLFETLEDLEVAAETLDALLSVEQYKSSTQGAQEIMIGYSDSAKSAGFFAAAWAQYRAQEALLACAQQHGIRLTLFHGRGGSVSRGGGSAFKALTSQAPGTLANGVRVTEQGEVIRYKFGDFRVALRNLEHYLCALLEGQLTPPPIPTTQWRTLMDQLASTSLEQYRKTVFQTPVFIQFFKAITPGAELQRMSLGSRPAKRKSSEHIDALRAIPWVFAWTQMRLMLPAWLGSNTALQEQIQAGNLPALKEMLSKWPYFGMLIEMQEMVLSKTESQIAEYYQQRLSQDTALDKLGNAFRAWLNEAKTSIETITGEPLLESNGSLKESIAMRNPYLEPLHIIQVELMNRLRQQADSGASSPSENSPSECSSLEHSHLEKVSTTELALMVSISGIAAGLRNTG